MTICTFGAILKWFNMWWYMANLCITCLNHLFEHSGDRLAGLGLAILKFRKQSILNSTCAHWSTNTPFSSCVYCYKCHSIPDFSLFFNLNTYKMRNFDRCWKSISNMTVMLLPCKSLKRKKHRRISKVLS